MDIVGSTGSAPASTGTTAAGVQTVEQPKLLDADTVEKYLGIFTAFIPQRIEKLYWQSEIDAMPEKERDHLSKRGITPVGIPDGDKDHAGSS